jgi:uncharacterized membrane protein YhaH (DUF805 family)
MVVLEECMRTAADYLTISMAIFVLAVGSCSALHLGSGTGGLELWGLSASSGIWTCVLLGLGWNAVAVAQRRLRDLGWPKWWAFPVCLLSFAGSVTLIILRIGNLGGWLLVYLVPQLPLLLGKAKTQETKGM